MLFFFLNTKSVCSLESYRDAFYGDISFMNIYCSETNPAVERIICFLAYYYQCIDEDTEREITFLRGSLEEAPIWDQSVENFNQISVNISTTGMEESDAPTFVDFANQDIHIGCIIPSLTQEEVLFSCSPEAFISMLICERLGRGDVLVIKNVRRYCSYTGYLYNFKFTGFYEYKIFNILVMDACFEGHFTKSNITRDMNKAYLGFTLCNSKISTGHWGCGAFGGEKVSKFLQQLCAAVLAKVDLDYSTFKDQECKRRLETVLKILKEKNIEVMKVFNILLTYNKKMVDQIEFYEYLLEELEK